MNKCSMQKKQESLAKKNESDYGAFDWTVGVSYLENGTGEAVKDVYLIKAHNMNSAKEQAILRANRKGSDAHVYSCKLGEHIYGEAKKHTCSMNKKKESLTKKDEGLSEYISYTNPDNGRTASLDPVKHPGLNKFIVYFGAGEKRYSSIKDAEDDLKSRGYEKDESKKEAKKHTCSMQKKKESLLVKSSKKQESVFDEIDPSNMLAQTFDEILGHTNDEIVISDSGVAEALGKYAIDDAFHVTDARNEDEFVDEATSILSGSPLDGSPFTASDAEDYARELWNA